MIFTWLIIIRKCVVKSLTPHRLYDKSLAHFLFVVENMLCIICVGKSICMLSEQVFSKFYSFNVERCVDS